MNRTDFPEGQVAPLHAVARERHGLPITFANAFGVTRADGSWTLIDIAPPFTDTIVRKWPNIYFSTPLDAIVFSQGHFDHTSGASALADDWHTHIYPHASTAVNAVSND